MHGLDRGRIHLSLTVSLALASLLAACTTTSLERCSYTIVQVTANGDQDIQPRLDAHNNVIWSGWDGDSELFVYDSTTQTTTQITHNTRSDADPQVNDHGQIAWSAYDGNDTEIYLYDGTGVVQITNNSRHDSRPSINNHGAIAWVATVATHEGTSAGDIFLYDAGTISRITSTATMNDRAPQLNDAGDIAWHASPLPSGDDEVFLRSGTSGSITQVTSNTYSDCAPRINALGDIAWIGGDGSDLEAFFRPASSGVPIQLTNVGFATCLHTTVDINDNGYAVFTARPTGSSHSQVWLYDGSSTTQITNAPRSSRDAQIDDDNIVVYWVNAPLAPAGPDDELFCYNPATGETRQITDDAVSNDVRPRINADRYLVWEGNDATGNDSEIFLGIPNGPDLAVTDLTHSPAAPGPGTPITFTAVVRNIGSEDAEASTLVLRVGGETFGEELPVPALVSGASHTVQRQETLGVVTNYVYAARCDADDDVEEINEQNNERIGRLAVSAESGPDLVVESLTHTPGDPTTTTLITVTAVVRNAGNAPAAASTVNVRIGGETLGTDFTVPALGVGASHSVQRLVRLGVAGSYRNTATADSGHEVAELDEANNVTTDSYSVE